MPSLTAGSWECLHSLLGSILPLAFASSRTGRRGRELHPTQRAILDLLDEEPGLNHTEICEELGLARGTVQYHLRRLEDEDRIYQVSSGRETHYFRSTVPRGEAEKIAPIRAGRAMEIVEAVEQNPGLMQRELLEEIGMTRKVLREYMDRLAKKQELVDEAEVGRERRYFLTETYESVEGLLRNGSRDGASVDGGENFE